MSILTVIYLFIVLCFSLSNTVRFQSLLENLSNFENVLYVPLKTFSQFKISNALIRSDTFTSVSLLTPVSLTINQWLYYYYKLTNLC